MCTSIFADVTLIRSETALMVYFMLLRSQSKVDLHDFYIIVCTRAFQALSLSRSRGSNNLMIIVYNEEVNFRATDKAGYFEE